MKHVHLGTAQLPLSVIPIVDDETSSSVENITLQLAGTGVGQAKVVVRAYFLVM